MSTIDGTWFARYRELYHAKSYCDSSLAFVGICLFIISEWVPLSDGLLSFFWIEFKVTGQLIGLASVGVTTHKTSNGTHVHFQCWMILQRIPSTDIPHSKQ